MKYLISMLAALALVVSIPQAVQAAEVTVESGVSSAYVFRGVTLNDEGVVQSALDVGFDNGLGINVWGNLDIGDFGGKVAEGEFSEIDLTVRYDLPFELPVDTQVGIIHYTFPGSSTPGTTELFGRVGYTVLDGLDVGVDGYFDVDELTDVYVNLNAQADLSKFIGEIPENITPTVSVGVGIAGDDIAAAQGGTDAGFSDLNITGDVAYAVNDSTTVSAFLAFTQNLDEDVLPDQEVDVYGGAKVTYKF